MALFDNVTYTYYTETLGRSVVPDADTFNSFKLENELYIKQLINDGLILARNDTSFDDACCLFIECDYETSQELNAGAGGSAPIAGENIGGYSYSLNTKAYDIAVEKNQKSNGEKKYKWLGLFCEITAARR
jgi:hypothetical protein